MFEGRAVPGDLTISAATVQLNANNQIASGAVVTVGNSGLLDTNNHFNTVGSLRLSDSTVKTGTGTLTVVTKEGGSPREGAKIGAEGEFRSAFTLGTETAAVLVEKQRFTP